MHLQTCPNGNFFDAVLLHCAPPSQVSCGNIFLIIIKILCITFCFRINLKNYFSLQILISSWIHVPSMQRQLSASRSDYNNLILLI